VADQLEEEKQEQTEGIVEIENSGETEDVTNA